MSVVLGVGGVSTECGPPLNPVPERETGAQGSSHSTPETGHTDRPDVARPRVKSVWGCGEARPPPRHSERGVTLCRAPGAGRGPPPPPLCFSGETPLHPWAGRRGGGKGETRGTGRRGGRRKEGRSRGRGGEGEGRDRGASGPAVGPRETEARAVTATTGLGDPLSVGAPTSETQPGRGRVAHQ